MLSDIKQEIIRVIKADKINTSSVADSLGRTGHLPGLNAVNRRHSIVGEVEYLYAYNGSNWPTHEDLAKVTAGNILYIDGINCKSLALIGSLMSRYAFQYKKVLGIVVNGLVRDADELIENNWPVWASGFTPLVCVKVDAVETDKAKINALKEKIHGGILVCDDCGCVLISPQQIDQQLLEKLKKASKQEAHWQAAMDQGYTTFEITCARIV